MVWEEVGEVVRGEIFVFFLKVDKFLLVLNFLDLIL